MEKVGLQRGLDFLRGNNIEVGTLVTDRHTEVQCFMRKEHPDIKHHIDVWHVAKSKSLSFRSCLRRHCMVIIYCTILVAFCSHLMGKMFKFLHLYTHVMCFSLLYWDATNLREIELHNSRMVCCLLPFQVCPISVKPALQFNWTSHPKCTTFSDLKKIATAACIKQYSTLQEWSKTIVRHLHWCANTSGGDGHAS